MSLTYISKSTQLLKSSSKIIFPKCFKLNNTYNSNFKLILPTKNFSSTSIHNASTFDFSKHTSEANTILGYNKIAQLKNSKEIKDSLEYVKNSWNQYLLSEGFDTNFKNLKIVEEESNHPGKVVMKFVVQKVSN